MVFLTGIRLANGGHKNEHIVEVRWYNPKTEEKGIKSTAEMVRFILVERGEVWVVIDNKSVRVEAVDYRYLRTQADDDLNNNLLSLPRL